MKPKGEIQVSPKLEIELVPFSCVLSNFQLILSKIDWDTLRKLVYKNANYKCEICGEKGEDNSLQCHEVWIYDELYADDIPEPRRTQKLSHLQSLCPLCYEAKHFGVAQIKENGERAKETLKRINGWNDEQVKDYVGTKFIEWYQRSKHKWILDITKMRYYQIDMSRYIDKLKP